MLFTSWMAQIMQPQSPVSIACAWSPQPPHKKFSCSEVTMLWDCSGHKEWPLVMAPASSLIGNSSWDPESAAGPPNKPKWRLPRNGLEPSTRAPTCSQSFLIAWILEIFIWSLGLQRTVPANTVEHGDNYSPSQQLTWATERPHQELPSEPFRNPFLTRRLRSQIKCWYR